MKMIAHSVDDDVTIPENNPLIVFSDNGKGSLICQIAYYNPKPYVRWHTAGGEAVLNVINWMTIYRMEKLIKSSSE